VAIKPEKDGDLHMRVRLGPQFEYLLNDRDDQAQGGNLGAELACVWPVTQRAAGALGLATGHRHPVRRQPRAHHGRLRAGHGGRARVYLHPPGLGHEHPAAENSRPLVAVFVAV
jgi:hypothetical protein